MLIVFVEMERTVWFFRNNELTFQLPALVEIVADTIVCHIWKI